MTTSVSMLRPILSALLLFPAVLSLGGCMHRCEVDAAWGDPFGAASARRAVSPTAADLSAFAGCDDVAQTLATALAPAGPPAQADWPEPELGWCWGIDDGGGVLPGGQMYASDAAPDRAALGGDDMAESGDFAVRTGVNQQEESVDEADILQLAADGRVYVAHAGELRVFAGTPATAAAELGRLALPAPAFEMFLGAATDTVIAVAGRGYAAALQLVQPGWGGDVVGMPEPMPADDMGGSEPGVGAADRPDDDWYDGPAETRILLVDFAQPATGEILVDLQLDGEYLTSRRLPDGRLVVVTRFLPPAVAAVAVDAAVQSDAAAAQAGSLALATFRERVAARLAAAGAAGLTPGVSAGVAEPAMLACEDMLHPDGTPPALFTAVWFVDAAAGTVTQTVIQQAGDRVYVSPDNLWLAQSGEGWWWEDGRAAGSALWRVPLAADSPQVAAGGVVEGWIPSRMHMGEHVAALRVFSHDGYATRLSIVDAASTGDLPLLGEVKDIAPGENLQGVRFLGDRAFAVTFRQTDPLFSFDVADPRAPRLVGELVIPGFSTYLHPIGDDHLVTVGFAGTGDGLTGDLQVQLFDVSDMARPTRVDWLEPSVRWALSEALDEPRAFTFDPRSGLLVLPLAGETATGPFSGFGVYAVDVTHGIRELGLVAHPDQAWARRARVFEEGDLLGLLSLSTSALVWSDLDDLAAGPLAELPLE
jgi:hypothetical protein